MFSPLIEVEGFELLLGIISLSWVCIWLRFQCSWFIEVLIDIFLGDYSYYCFRRDQINSRNLWLGGVFKIFKFIEGIFGILEDKLTLTPFICLNQWTEKEKVQQAARKFNKCKKVTICQPSSYGKTENMLSS